MKFDSRLQHVLLGRMIFRDRQCRRSRRHEPGLVGIQQVSQSESSRFSIRLNINVVGHHSRILHQGRLGLTLRSQFAPIIDDAGGFKIGSPCFEGHRISLLQDGGLAGTSRLRLNPLQELLELFFIHHLVLYLLREVVYITISF